MSKVILYAMLIGIAVPAFAAAPPAAEQYLHSGQFTEGEKALLKLLKDNPKDDQARYGLGLVQFVSSIEQLGQSFYRYGLNPQRAAGRIPLFRMPVPENPKPETISYPLQRKIFQTLLDNLAKTEATLAGISDDKVMLPIRVGLVKLDLTGQGSNREEFRRILARYLGGGQPDRPAADDFKVNFDRGDVAWFRGYCHLLSAIAEFVLAYDGQELFDCTAHLLFEKVETPHGFLKNPDKGPDGIGGMKAFEIVDLISLIHLIRMPVKEPERMKASLAHLEKMLALSKETWVHILAETDDDCEWLPNPKQTGVMRIPVSKEMIDSWLEFVDESQAILAGKKLVPFWRGDGEKGLNLRRVFTEPRPFDLVLWIQGTAATPYLEKGTMTKPEVWERLQRTFAGDFLGFAIWFN